jgi:hypothetical protein
VHIALLGLPRSYHRPLVQKILINCKLDSDGNIDFSAFEEDIIRERRIYNDKAMTAPRGKHLSSVGSMEKPWRQDQLVEQKNNPTEFSDRSRVWNRVGWRAEPEVLFIPSTIMDVNKRSQGNNAEITVRRLYVLPCRECKSESDEDGSSSSSSSSSTATLKESSSEPEAYWLTAVHLTGPVRAAYDPYFK